jgi:hypothetical protein
MRRNHNQHPKQNQTASIVSIVGGMVIRESFASGGEGRRGLPGRWQTRTSTALLVVCLSLVLCLGVRVLCIRSHLGGIGAFLPVVLRVSAFGVVVMIGLVPFVMVHVMGMLSLAVVCLLDVLHLVINMSLGEVTTLSLRGATYHVFPFVVFVLLQRNVRLFPMVVIALIGWIFLTPLLRKWHGTGLTLFVLTPVLRHLLALALGFDFAGGRLGGLLPDRLWRIAIRY